MFNTLENEQQTNRRNNKIEYFKTWGSAKDEWDFEYAYQSDTPQTCLCGHYPIINICVIKNNQNDNETEVGNCCVNKFLGIENGNKIFDSIKRLKEDIIKSMSVEVLEYLNDKKVITGFEYDFYTDTLKKRVLSPKQLDIRKKINKKFLTFTNPEVNATMSKINCVLKWAENNKWFDTSFILSLKHSFEKFGKLTPSQMQALDNIIKKQKLA